MSIVQCRKCKKTIATMIHVIDKNNFLCADCSTKIDYKIKDEKGEKK